MCGIAGFLNFRGGAPLSETLIRQMLAMIRHRGPDQFGIYMDDRLAMGNARLSIVDLASGQQPINTADERYWIVYNGEIFNHRELRASLESKGHRFTTSCDTEVFLHLYVEEGPACLDRLNGQFAVAIWDSLEEELFLARDRLGVRPLFYHQHSGGMVFGSEIKALAVHPEVSLQIDPAAMDQIFTGWSCLAPRTPFESISQLPPGHYAVVKGGRLSIHRYWQPDFSPENRMAGGESPGEEELVDSLEELLTDATRLRLLADVPVGAYLSGGLDSSLIAALVRRFATGRFDTFSIAFTDSAFDEREHQLRMARHLGTDHQVVEASHADIGAVFPDVVWHCESPLLRTAPAPMFLLSRLVKSSGYKVVLTGEGADEFFAGYDIFKETAIRAFWSRQPGSTIRPRLLQRIYPDLPNLSKLGPRYLASFFGERLLDRNDADYSHAIRWRNTSRCRRFFSADLNEQIRRLAKPLLESVPLPARFNSWGVLERAQYLEIVTFLSPYLLSSQGDRVSMAHSVEGRYPFLDCRVSDFSSRLPARDKLRTLRDKYLLRKLGRRLLPPDIWQRPKKPYRAPIHRSFLGSGSPNWVREVLSEEALTKAGLFNPLAVGALVARINQGYIPGETDEMALVGILSSQLLHHQFVSAFEHSAALTAHDDIKRCDRRKSACQADA